MAFVAPQGGPVSPNASSAYVHSMSAVAQCTWHDLPKRGTLQSEALAGNPRSLPLMLQEFDRDIESVELYDDEPPTTIRARQCATDVVFELAEQFGTRWLNPFVSSDDMGGLRLTWRNSSYEVRGLISGETGSADYIYTEGSDGHRLVEGFSKASLRPELEALLGTVP